MFSSVQSVVNTLRAGIPFLVQRPVVACVIALTVGSSALAQGVNRLESIDATALTGNGVQLT